jgi:hypothetical protein
MTRFVAVCAVAVAAVGASAAVARAEGTLPNGAAITFERVFITEGGEVKEPSTPDVLRQYFNLAHCVCSQSMAGEEQTFEYELKSSVDTAQSLPVSFYFGTNCNIAVDRDETCIPAGMIDDVDNLLTPERVKFSVYDAVNVTTAGACTQMPVSTLLWAMVDTTPGGDHEYWVTQEVPKTPALTDAAIDTQAPPALTKLSAAGGEESVRVSWDIPEGREDDFYVFQALCSRADDSQAKTEGRPERKYDTPMSLCGAGGTFDLTPIDLPDSEGDLPVDSLPGTFAALDETFLCGEQQGATAKTLDIKGLENGVPYKVAILAVDRAGNASGAYFTRTVTPKPVIDFWEDLNSRDDEINGGCLLAETYGGGSALTRGLRAFRDGTLARSTFGRLVIDAYYATLGKLGPVVQRSVALRAIAAIALAPLVAVALLWHLLTLPGLLLLLALPWLWRRRRRWVPRFALAAAVLVPRFAAADDFTPYWDDPDADAQLNESYDEVKWHVGIRVGPYIPDIDIQFGLNAKTGLGPYEAMFGDWFTPDANGNQVRHNRHVWQVMPMLDVDRVLWSGVGQLAVGGHLGYMQKSAHPYADGSLEDDEFRPRSTSSDTAFHLIPLAATATFRLTYLDDMFGVPLVPYVKGGLSYYAWWISGADKTFAESCAADGTMCDTARGGSVGYEGSIGLSIRAERIDANAAMSMKNSGIQHAGFYAELFWAKVDGFGSGSRLSVGDTTWFAGVDFEF